ncbi:MAG: outer membrane beta-barrel protein [Candidatus Omnitrophica bacterium]|nr:outer membrane beta-barrel protein [Candidatus Omnitrophota bacterium]
MCLKFKGLRACGRISRSLSLFVLLFIFSAVPAYAYKVGGVDVHLVPSVHFTFDDNVGYDHENEIDDFIYILRFGLKADYEAKTESLSFLGHFNYNKYQDNERFDNWSQDFTVSFLKEFSEYLRLELSDRFEHAEEPSSFEDEFGRDEGRYSFVSNTITASLSKDVSKYLTLSGSYSNNIYDASREETDDSYYNSLALRADYLFSSHLTLQGFYRFSHRTYQGPGTIYFNTLALGSRYYFNSRLYADLTGAADFIHTLDGEDIVRPLFLGKLTRELDERSRAYLSFSRRSTAGATTQALFERWQFAIGADSQLFRRLYGFTELFYGEGEYDRLKIDDEFHGVSLGIVYEINEDTTVEARYSFSRTDSNLYTRDYKKNHFSLGLTREF